jgi:diaminohydroxyphosphoribosylaminopyrimidine deaminase/5-amino-6-(5-phosphoribosylamino)uracil reductase
VTASGFMQRALDAGLSVRGSTSPNPWVGAALVRDGAVIATGATRPPGGAHAEAAALDGVDARGAELYVTLEPCSPFPGKRTRPCVEAVIEAGVRRVVIALEDPDPRVRGRGIAALRGAGVAVEVGDGRDEAGALLRPYLKHRETGLPYVIAKFAASLDGRTATRTGDSKWITGAAAREMGHQQRAWVDAVLVGSGTILADDAELTARPGGVAAARQPARVILDARGRVAPAARVFTTGGGVIVATTGASPGTWRAAVAAMGVQVIECEAAQPGVNLDQLLQALGQSGIMSIWAEGGGTLLGALFDGGHVDEVWAFLAPVIIGGSGAQAAVGGNGAARLADAWRLTDVAFQQVGEDVLVRGYVDR